jgi:hypothetical protein
MDIAEDVKGMTDSTMVEKAAEAIWQAEWARAGNRGKRRVPWNDNSPEHMDRYRFLARAAIEALMEPTPALMAAQTDTDPDIARVAHENRAKLYSEPF